MRLRVDVKRKDQRPTIEGPGGVELSAWRSKESVYAVRFWRSNLLTLHSQGCAVQSKHYLRCAPGWWKDLRNEVRKAMMEITHQPKESTVGCQRECGGPILSVNDGRILIDDEASVALVRDKVDFEVANINRSWSRGSIFGDAVDELQGLQRTSVWTANRSDSKAWDVHLQLECSQG